MSPLAATFNQAGPATFENINPSPSASLASSATETEQTSPTAQSLYCSYCLKILGLDLSPEQEPQ